MSTARGWNRSQLLALAAAVLAAAIIATLVIGSHVLRSAPVPSRPVGSTTPPSPRSGASLVYDAANRALVLFGGSTVDNRLVNETWTWDGRLWTLEHPAAAPAARHESVMAYDEAHHDVVLYGGMAVIPTSGKGGQAAVTDTWTWSGTTWTQRHPRHEPPLGFDWPPTLQFDPVTRTVLLFGFKKATSENLTNMQPETWSWDGSDWSLRSPSASPTGAAVMVGGTAHVYLLAPSAGVVGGRYVTQMWQWEGGTWTLLPPNNDDLAPVTSAAYDPQRGQIVAVNFDTWTWDGSRWTRQHVTQQPPAVGYMAYFAPLREVVSFGDRLLNRNNDMWAWTGTDWNRLAEGTAAPAPTPAGELGPTTPAAAATFIRQTVSTTTPVLLPTSLPDGLAASVIAGTDNFVVAYVSDQRDKRITLAITVPNPPPGGDNASDTRVKFRNALALKGSPSGYAEYFVFDTTASTSSRWLMWIEPGSSTSSNLPGPGVPYFLSADGLTDHEFWQVANSLR